MLSYYDCIAAKEQQQLPFWLSWQIWKACNDLIFNKVSWFASDILSKAKDNCTEWLMAVSKDLDVPTSTPSNNYHQPDNHWKPPPPDFVKVNVDGSFIQKHQYVGIGWIGT
ncbi:hypothetical protein V5N11_034683 [Cardamine amara subsp. amara]|uniref:RNase H type-1 domain-containing protein n=1 Tax=Cardamine amara subsp. amara TaxID=228776 RepID=A0ABD1AMA6_CARAN